jgi:hypothetical protein
MQTPGRNFKKEVNIMADEVNTQEKEMLNILDAPPMGEEEKQLCINLEDYINSNMHKSLCCYIYYRLSGIVEDMVRDSAIARYCGQSANQLRILKSAERVMELIQELDKYFN